MKNIIILILFLASHSYCYSTPQVGDLLIYNNDTISIYPFILDQYIENSPNKEAIYSEIKKVSISSTACWRGYIAVFEIKNDSLFLQKAYGKKDIDLRLIFGKSNNIFLNWYSGTMTSPKDLIIYEHDGWGGFYEYETDFSFENGILKKTEKHHNTIIPSEYTNPDTLMNFIKSHIDYSKITIPNEKIKVTVRVEGVDKDGKINKLSVIKGHESYNDEAIRVIKSIPRWQIIYRRGKMIHKRWSIPVIFENIRP